jgi:hypothetical protein
MEALLANGDASGIVDFLMSHSLDPFQTLGLQPGAVSSSAVKRQYHKLSLLIHPDKLNHPSTDEAFKAVGSAKNSLLDPTDVPSILLTAGITGNVYYEAVEAAAETVVAKAKEAEVEAMGEVEECEEELAVAKQAFEDAKKKAAAAKRAVGKRSAGVMAAEAEKVKVRHAPCHHHRYAMRHATTAAMPCTMLCATLPPLRHATTAAMPCTMLCAMPPPPLCAMPPPLRHAPDKNGGAACRFVGKEVEHRARKGLLPQYKDGRIDVDRARGFRRGRAAEAEKGQEKAEGGW